jgi:hypothetical protein
MTISTRPSARPPLLFRRRVLQAAGAAALLGVAGCGSPLPLARAPATGPGDPAARKRVLDSAAVHGWEALRSTRDIAVAYDGGWRPLIGRIQPEVVDAGFRGASEERLLPGQGVTAQHYRGPRGSKLVHWQRGPSQVGVWRNEQPDEAAAARDAAALVADAYVYFLLGPMALALRPGFDDMAFQLSGTERVNGRLCDVVQADLAPGFGFAARDRVALSIDRDDGVARRLRLTLEGAAGTRGAVAYVDTFEHRRLFGILWPMRSYEEVEHPIRLPAHDWWITGLDLNRGYAAEALAGPRWAERAALRASPL